MDFAVPESGKDGRGTQENGRSKMSKNKHEIEDEVVYKLTPLGFLAIRMPEAKAKEIHDALELYCRRNGVGIAIEDNTLKFVELVKVD